MPRKKIAKTPDSKARQIRKPTLSLETVGRALSQTLGNQSAAARILGVTRQAVCHYIKNHPELRETIAEAIEERLDRAEHELNRIIGDTSSPHVQTRLNAIIFLLKTLGRTRGYVERQELGVYGKIETKKVVDVAVRIEERAKAYIAQVSDAE